MTLSKTHPLRGAVAAIDAYLLDSYGEAAIRALEAAGYRVVGPEPTEAQWGGLARAIVMWCQMTGPHTPVSLLQHLERTGETPPDWLLTDPEMLCLGALSKGTISAFVWRAMLAAAPTITETEKGG